MVIGVTGNTGSGKTTFARELAGAGLPLIDVDTLAHELLNEDAGIRARLKTVFGVNVVKKDGTVDRPALAGAVFPDPEMLQRLNAIIWPVMVAELEKRISRLTLSGGGPGVIADMAVLYEAQAAYLFDYIIVVSAPLTLRSSRLQHSRGWTETEVLQRNCSQISQEEKEARADLVVRNSGTPGQLRAAARECAAGLFGLHF